jgi:hypothetical protein
MAKYEDQLDYTNHKKRDGLKNFVNEAETFAEYFYVL